MTDRYLTGPSPERAGSGRRRLGFEEEEPT